MPSTKPQLPTQSGGGFTSKIRLRVDRLGRPITFIVTAGQACDSRYLQPLMAFGRHHQPADASARVWAVSHLEISCGELLMSLC